MKDIIEVLEDLPMSSLSPYERALLKYCGQTKPRESREARKQEENQQLERVDI